MEELIKLVSEKTGISADQARAAVNVVMEFLKQRLPAPVAGQIDSLLGKGSGGLGGVTKGLGSLLGR